MDLAARQPAASPRPTDAARRFRGNALPVNAPNARFTRAPPPVMCAALPHLTPEPEARYRELTPHARQWPPRPPTGQYRLQTAHFAAFWNIMIQHAHRLFRRLPPNPY